MLVVEVHPIREGNGFWFQELDLKSKVLIGAVAALSLYYIYKKVA